MQEDLEALREPLGNLAAQREAGWRLVIGFDQVMVDLVRDLATSPEQDRAAVQTVLEQVRRTRQSLLVALRALETLLADAQEADLYG